MVSALLSAMIGTWGCTPRPTVADTSTFTLAVNRIGPSTLGLQGTTIFPSGTSEYHTLTLNQDGTWTFDQGREPYPYTGQAQDDGSLVLAREAPSQDRYFWQVSPDGSTLRFSKYEATDFAVEREEHMVVCQRTSS